MRRLHAHVVVTWRARHGLDFTDLAKVSGERDEGASIRTGLAECVIHEC